MTFYTADDFDSENNKIYNESFFDVLPTLDAKSVDMVFADLPYNCTDCAWDKKVIDLDKMWVELKRIAKSDRTPFIFTCTTKFGYELIKSNPKMFKMDMVWKKRNKTGGLQSRYRPMRNHEMIYFFYKKAPCYNRDTYHKRIKTEFVKAHKIPDHATALGVEHTEKGKDFLGNNTKEDYESGHYDPPSLASVIDDTEMAKSQAGNMLGNNTKEGGSIYKIENDTSDADHKKWKEEHGVVKYDPVNPASVLEYDEEYKKKYTKEFLESSLSGAGVNSETDIYTKENSNEWAKNNKGFTPPNPASVLEIEADPNVNEKGKSVHGYDIKYMNSPRVPSFEPKLPASVQEHDIKVIAACCHGSDDPLCVKCVEHEDKSAVWGYKGLNPDIKTRISDLAKGTANFDPKLPVSCFGDMTEDMIEACHMCTCGIEPEIPQTTFESKKVFIGKRNHQTEKPLDLMEFFLKYWSNEEDTVLDHTMGSGSMGVACAKLNRKFIGCELNEKIFKVAVNRIKNKK